jgi:hypothetical protein
MTRSSQSLTRVNLSAQNLRRAFPEESYPIRRMNVWFLSDDRFVRSRISPSSINAAFTNIHKVSDPNSNRTRLTTAAAKRQQGNVRVKFRICPWRRTPSARRRSGVSQTTEDGKLWGGAMRRFVVERWVECVASEMCLAPTEVNIFAQHIGGVT